VSTNFFVFADFFPPHDCPATKGGSKISNTATAKMLISVVPHAMLSGTESPDPPLHPAPIFYTYTIAHALLEGEEEPDIDMAFISSNVYHAHQSDLKGLRDGKFSSSFQTATDADVLATGCGRWLRRACSSIEDS
jgi:hypothetical protein